MIYSAEEKIQVVADLETRKARISIVDFREIIYPPKCYNIDGRGDLTCCCYADYHYPATFIFGPESLLSLEVSRNDIFKIINLINDRIISDTGNAYKLRIMSFWEGLTIRIFNKSELTIDLSSRWLKIRRICGFWQLVIPQSIGFLKWTEGYSFTLDDWLKLSDALNQILQLTLHLKDASDNSGDPQIEETSK